MNSYKIKAVVMGIVLTAQMYESFVNDNFKAGLIYYGINIILAIT
jgi:hypothetical protein